MTSPFARASCTIASSGARPRPTSAACRHAYPSASSRRPRARGVAEGLLDVLALEFRPLREDLLHGHAGAQVAQDGGHGHPEPSDAGLPEAFLGIEGNAVKEEVTDLHAVPARRCPEALYGTRARN